MPPFCVAKVRLVGFNVTGSTPVPVRSKTRGFTLDLFATATLPLMAPGADGVNLTDMVHLPLAARVPPHGLLPLPTTAKSAEAVNDRTFTLAVPLLVTVTVLLALVTPVS